MKSIESRFGITLTSSTIVVVLAIFTFAEPHTLGIFSSDDSFYYYLTAKNITLGNGATFDGINPTNGFHPLWMTTLLPIFYFAGEDQDIALKTVYSILTILYFASIFISWKIADRIAGRKPAWLSLLLFTNPIIFNHFFNGLESGLLIFLLLLTIRLTQTRDMISPEMPIANRLMLGLMLGLVFLCRLDTAFLLIGLAISVLVFYRVRLWPTTDIVNIIKLYSPVVVVFVIIASPYFIWNYSVNGHLTPISGAIKTSFPDISFNARYLTFAGWLPYNLFVAGTLMCFLISLLLKNSYLRTLHASRGASNAFLIIIFGLWGGCLLHYTYSIAFTQWGTFYWHFASYVPFIIILFCLLTRYILAATKNSKLTIAALASTLFAASTVLQVVTIREKSRMHAQWHNAAKWVDENLPPDAVLGMTDCGYFAYFNNRTTINLDGLINGYDYQQALAEGTDALRAYFESCGLQYLCDYEVPVSQNYAFNLKLNRTPHAERKKGNRGQIITMPINKYVYASEPYSHYQIKQGSAPSIRFYIWKYDPSAVRPIR